MHISPTRNAMRSCLSNTTMDENNYLKAFSSPDKISMLWQPDKIYQNESNESNEIICLAKFQISKLKKYLEPKIQISDIIVGHMVEI